MAFGPEFLDELRARVALAGTIGRRVKLVKRGREYVALCPFHNEKTPSFTVNEDKGFFHCFGCGAHGDVIGFLMRADNLSFPEAVARLAAEAGLPIPAPTPEDDRLAEQERALLYEVVEAACAWFEAQLKAEVGKAASAYLEGRGLGDETIAEFRLGYAPSGRGALGQALAARRFSEEIMIEAGLLVAPEGMSPAYGRFRDRIIFPITDRRGRVIAFGGRALGEAKAKYLNSPETPLFHKGRVLYNLAQARAAAREAGTVVVAEGYMDVIALWGAGFRHVVAPLGTALTEAQLYELWRLAPEPVLCLDGDAAGRRAAYRAAERALPLLKPGHSLRFALMPRGEDPDSLIAKQGSEAMTALLAGAAPLSEVLWEKETAGRRIETPESRAALERRLLLLSREIRDETVRQYYRRHFKSRLWEAFRDSRSVPGAGRRAGGRDRITDIGALVSGTDELSKRLEELWLLTLVNHPALLERALEPLAGVQFASPELDSLRRAIIDIAGRRQALDTAAVKSHLAEEGFSEIVDRLSGREVAVHGGFAKQDAALENAEKGLNQIMARHRRAVTLQPEHEAAKAEYEKNPTPETEARFLASRKRLEETGGDEVDVESYGAAAGREASP